MSYKDMSTNWAYKSLLKAVDLNQLGLNDEYLRRLSSKEFKNYFQDYTTTANMTGGEKGIYPIVYFDDFTNDTGISIIGNIIIVCNTFINKGTIDASEKGGQGDQIKDFDVYSYTLPGWETKQRAVSAEGAFGGGRGGQGSGGAVQPTMTNFTILGGGGGTKSGGSDYGGDGGGIIIVICRTFENTSTGIIKANGGDGRPITPALGGVGGGGLIQILYQDSFTDDGTIEAVMGATGSQVNASNGIAQKIDLSTMTVTNL
jgi:hypothetical protein